MTFQGETPRIIQSTARFWAHRDSAPLFQGLLWCCWQLVFSGQWGQPDCLFGCWDAFVSEKLLWGHNHPDLSLIKQLHSESLVKLFGRLRKIRMSLNTILPDLRVKRQQKPVALASNSGWKTQTLWMEKFGCQAPFFQQNMFRCNMTWTMSQPPFVHQWFLSVQALSTWISPNKTN